MAKVLFAFLCVAILQTVFGLQCYSCYSKAGDKNCDELDDESKIEKISCGRTINDQAKSACLKKVIEETATKMINTTRSCVILPQDGKTDSLCKVASERWALKECQVCGFDLCNAGTNLNVNFLTILGTSTLLLFKFMY